MSCSSQSLSSIPGQQKWDCALSTTRMCVGFVYNGHNQCMAGGMGGKVGVILLSLPVLIMRLYEVVYTETLIKWEMLTDTKTSFTMERRRPITTVMKSGSRKFIPCLVSLEKVLKTKQLIMLLY